MLVFVLYTYICYNYNTITIQLVLHLDMEPIMRNIRAIGKCFGAHNNNIDILLCPTDTIASIKQKLFEQYDFQIDIQRIKFGAEVYTDDTFLSAIWDDVKYKNIWLKDATKPEWEWTVPLVIDELSPIHRVP